MKKRNWRIHCVTVVLFLVLIGWGTYAEAAGTVTIFLDQKTLDVDDTLKVTVQTSEPEDDAIPPEVTLTYDNRLLEFTYCSEEYGGGEGGLITLHSTTANLTFVAKKAGTASLNAEAVIDDDGNHKATASRSVSITGTGTTENTETVAENGDGNGDDTSEKTDAGENEDGAETESAAKVRSSDASLKKMKVTDAKLSPKFSPDVTDYTVTLKEDVKQLVYTAKTTDEKARILAASGFSNLKNGSNKAVINVVAEDGTRKTYTFTILKEGNAANSEDSASRESAEAVNGYIPVAGGDLCVNATFPEEVLPEGFAKIDYVYKEQLVEAAYCEMGEVILLYLSGADGSMGDFYIYYSGTDEFMDFIQLKGGEGHFIFPIQFPAGVVIPDGFQDSALQWNDKTVAAFMVSQVNQETEENPNNGTKTDTEVSDGGESSQTGEGDKQGDETKQGIQYAQPEDFYLVYAMNQDGAEGFYLYDSLEGTYQRYLDLVESDSNSGVFDDESYVIYKEKSQKRMVVIGFLIVLVVILGFLLLNMFLKIRDLEEETSEDEEEDQEKNHRESKQAENGDGKKTEKKPEKKPERKPDKKPKKQEEKNLEKETGKTLEKKQVKKPEKETVGSQSQRESQKPRTAAARQNVELEQKKEKKQRPAPVMFDLTTPKVDGSLTPKMQREQLDDDFEFEFINIDE